MRKMKHLLIRILSLLSWVFVILLCYRMTVSCMSSIWQLINGVLKSSRVYNEKQDLHLHLSLGRYEEFSLSYICFHFFTHTFIDIFKHLCVLNAPLDGTTCLCFIYLYNIYEFDFAERFLFVCLFPFLDLGDDSEYVLVIFITSFPILTEMLEHIRIELKGKRFQNDFLKSPFLTGVK